MTKVSIIVPIYNVEKYLSQCIDSILAQTLKDIEIICIDDGSTDSSGEIIDRYANLDERIKVIHKENTGYGATMNEGINLATGDYIGIVESDDMIDPKMYDNLYEYAIDNDLDFVKSDAYYWFEKINYRKRVHDRSLDNFYNKMLGENERNIFFDFFMNIWTGIYKKDFLLQNNISFHESHGASYQDNGFWMQTCFYAKRVMWLNAAFYYYRQDNPEASVKSKSKMMAMTKEYEYLENIIKERNQENLLAYIYAIRMVRLKGTFYRIEDKQKYDFIHQIRKDYESYKAYIKYNNYLDNWLREFLRAPEEYCDNIIKKKTEVKNRILESNGIIIFGAGQQGDIAMRILYNEGLYDKIICFAVTDKSEETFMGLKSVMEIESAHEKYPNSLYLLAVSYNSKAYFDMQEKLNELGVHEYIQMTDLLEKFNFI